MPTAKSFDCCAVIKAIGQKKQIEFFQHTGIELDEKGRVVVNELCRPQTRAFSPAATRSEWRRGSG